MGHVSLVCPESCRDRDFLLALGSVLARFAVLLLLAVPVVAKEYRAVDANEWQQIRKAIPQYLWATRQRRKIEDLWKAGAYDEVKLDKKQFAELASILRAGSPYTTERMKSRTVKVRPSKGKKLPVRVAVTS